MIRRLVDFALDHRLLVLLVAAVLLAAGVVSFLQLPVDAYPDVAPIWVQVITQWPGRAAEEVEQQVTVPIEIQMAGIPDLAHLRSVSLAGLSVVNLIFDDASDNNWDREKTLERLSQVTLPATASAQIGPDYSPVGQIYWYTLESSNPSHDLMALKSLQDWVVSKYFKSVPNVVDDSSFGGITREYQVRVDPDRLVAYGLSIGQVEQQLAANNANAGGSFIQAGGQEINVRAVGQVTSVQDIENVALKTEQGAFVRVGQIGTVTQGPKIRLGQIGKALHRADGVVVDDPDVVEGILFLRKGAGPGATLVGIHAMEQHLNRDILPPGVRIVPYLDRSDLIHLTTHTVLHNLAVGMFLVVVVLFLFLGNLRGAFIVALTIPFSLLFAAFCLDLRHIPANLLSLGALDFGMVVDGAVVMVENIVRRENNSPPGANRLEVLRQAAHEVQRPVFYAIAIIISAYLPIFTLQSVEGKLFRPMAWTVAFALLGALIFSMLVAPVLASFSFRRGAAEWRNPILAWLTARYRVWVARAIHHRYATAGVAAAALLISAWFAFGGILGKEFLPHLDEGAIWVRGTLAPSTGPDESIAVTNRARQLLASFPEVTQVVSQSGRPDDGTDSTGFFNTEYFVDLKPKSQWRPVFNRNKDALIASMNRELETIPGVIWNFSQPIADNVEEAMSGIKGELAVKIFGDDLRTLEAKGDQIVQVMSRVPGIQDLGEFRVLGQPNLNLTVDRAAAARYGINVADVQDAIQTAVGGNPVTQVLQGEQRYDLVVRYLPAWRDTQEAIANIRLLAPSGERVALSQLTDVQVADGASEIYREAGSRYIAVKFSVRGRDLGGAVEDAMRRVQAEVKLPPGYSLDWSGEYASEQRAAARLEIVLPATLVLIFIILYTMFDSAKWVALMFVNVAMTPLGGLLALWITGTHFSVSSGVGFLALFGVSVQTGVIMLEYINQLRARGEPVVAAAIQGAVLRLRPILMTMLVATLGLLPAALSHDIGSDSQRPFAIVIVGGLVSSLALSVFLLPTLYVWAARPGDRLPAAGN